MPSPCPSVAIRNRATVGHGDESGPQVDRLGAPW